MIIPCLHLLATCINDCFIVRPKFQAKFAFEVEKEVFIPLPILGILSGILPSFSLENPLVRVLDTMDRTLLAAESLILLRQVLGDDL